MTTGTPAAALTLPVTDCEPHTLCQTKPAKRWSRKVAYDVVAIADGIAIFLGAAVPATIYGYIGGAVSNWVLLAQTCFAAALITHLCLRYWDQYDTSRVHDLPIEPSRLLAALFIGLGSMAGLGLPHALQDGHVWVWLLTWISASFMMLLIARGVAQKVLAKFTAKGRFDQRVAVFGAGVIARRVHDHLVSPGLASSGLGIHFVGVFDDRAGEERINPEGLTVTGKLDQLIAAARNDEIDRIVIALPQSAGDRIAMIARKLEQLPVSVHIVTHIASDLMDARGQHQVSNLGPVGLLDVKPKPLSGWAPVVKNIEDKVLATLLLIATAPLFPVIALAIKAESQGPVFFQQGRRGFNQRVFDVIKFRTMYVHDDAHGVQQATPGDVRVTKVGCILRRLSLDELPQLFNVLKGEMSLVGPRPHALDHDDKFGSELDTYANRHQVKPGMTGLAQVQGLRGATTTADALEARVNADIEYIRTWSLWLDLKILGRTVLAVLSGRNAH